MNTATKHTRYTLSSWPVNSPVDDRRGRPKGSQHKGLMERKAVSKKRRKKPSIQEKSIYERR